MAYDRQATIRFIASNALGEPGRYRYSASCAQPTLYASAYAAMTLSLLDALDGHDLAAWRAYLLAHQQPDGLFRDPVIYGQGWYAGDPLWCGRSHLTCHVLTALACLGGTADKELAFTEPWKDSDYLVRWLEARNWAEDVANSGNEIMNIGNLLQYARDFHADARAGAALETLLAWLSARANPATGLWGTLDITVPYHHSNAVQAAYHWWNLFFYDGVVIPYPDKAAASILQTQNPNGGFGQGVHNPDEPFVSSACEDIDSLDPLARLYASGVCRTEPVKRALETGAAWVASNRVPDGGFVFIKNRPFEYGHPELTGGAGQGAMFPTWFRTLTLAITDRALAANPAFEFIRCPGYQFFARGSDAHADHA